MKKQLMLIIFFIAVVLLFGDFEENALLFTTSDSIYVYQTYEDSLRTNHNWFNNYSKMYGINKIYDIYNLETESSKEYCYLIRWVSNNTVLELVDIFSKNFYVNYAQPNNYASLDSDPLSNNQWYLEKIAMNQEWYLNGISSGNHLVGVLDTGLDLGVVDDSIHADLEFNLHSDDIDRHGFNASAYCGLDTLYSVNKPQDISGHGTHVAGIIGATNRNSIGIAGIMGGDYQNNSQGCLLYPIKTDKVITSGASVVTMAAVLRGINQGISDNVRIFNCSFGYNPWADVTLLRNMVNNYSYNEEQAMFICSAGNNYRKVAKHPASFEATISVCATDSLDRIVDYSNYHHSVDIAAPGGYAVKHPSGIYSTLPNNDTFLLYETGYQQGYDYLRGTSFAAPMVTGAYGLVKQAYPNLTNFEIRDRLCGTTDDISLQNQDFDRMGNYGAGRLNIYRALNENEHPTLRLKDVFAGDNRDYITMGEENIPIFVQLKNWWVDCQDIVSGTLSCNNPDIEIVNDSTFWNPIGNREYAQNEVPFIINNNSRTFGDVEFELTIDSDGYIQTLYFSLINHSSYSSLIPDDCFSNMTPNSEITVFDMNGDGIDELVFTTIDSLGYGRVNLIIDGELKYYDEVSNLAKVNPIIADINSDGEYEIIVVDNRINGSFIVTLKLQNNGERSNLIMTNVINITNDLNLEIHSLLVNDINKDGILDFTLSINENSYVHSIIAILNGEYHLDTQRLLYDLDEFYPDYQFLCPIASGNIDASSSNEILFLIGAVNNTSTTSTVRTEISKLTFHDNRNAGFWVSKTHEIFNETYNATIHNFSATDIIISNPHPNEVTSNHPYIYVGLGGTRVANNYNNSYNSFYQLFCYDFKQDSPEQKWIYNPNSNELNNMIDIRDGGSIIAGDFLTNNPGIEIIVSGTEEIIDSETGQFLQYITNETDFLGMYHSVNNLTPSVLTGSIGSNNSEMFCYNDSKILCYDNSKKEVKRFTNIIPPEMEVTSLVSANLNTSTSRNIVLLMTDSLHTYISSILISDQRENYTYQWSQRQGNSRKTCEYLQPFPKIIDTDYYIWNDVELNGLSKTDAYIEIAPGTELSAHYLAKLTLKGGLILYGEEDNPIKISGLCGEGKQNYWQGLTVSNKTRLSMNTCEISNSSTALSLYDSGRREIQDCTFANNQNAILMYNSSLIMSTSSVQNSDYGIELHNSADIIMGSPYPSMNRIVRNDVGIMLYNSELYMKEGHNSVVNYDWNVITENSSGPYSVQENFWGTSLESDFVNLFNNPAIFCYDPWLLTDPIRDSSTSDSYFILAERERMVENWDLAISNYQQAFTDTVNVAEKYLVLSGLYDCYNQTNSLSIYRQWLMDNILVTEELNLVKSMYNTLALVNRSLNDFNSALSYYEGIIDEPASYIDSCYAAIDIGFTVLESSNRARSKYLHLNPASYESHYKLVDKLLISIRDNQPIEDSYNVSMLPRLHQNYPNPFNPSTTISFYNPTEGKVELKVYNLKGQLVKKLINDNLGAGVHSIVWNGDNNESKNVASGVYFYRFKTNNKTLVKKCLLLK